MRRGDRTAGSFASFVTFLSNKEKFINPPDREKNFVRRGEFVRKWIEAGGETPPLRCKEDFVRRRKFAIK